MLIVGFPRVQFLILDSFFLYTNFIDYNISSTRNIPDDLKFISVITANPDSIRHDKKASQHDINNLYLMASSWGLAMSINKQAALRISRWLIVWSEVSGYGEYLLIELPRYC